VNNGSTGLMVAILIVIALIAMGVGVAAKNSVRGQIQFEDQENQEEQMATSNPENTE
jgi:hypothetical protein